MLKTFAGYNLIHSEQEWFKWFIHLEEGDKCLYQDFVPLESGILGSSIECFRYWPAEFWGNRVWYDNETHPLKDGIGIYWNSEDPVNNVFPGRVVPWVEELVNPSLRFIDSDRPIFEPKWWTDRCYILVDHGGGFNEGMRAAKEILKHIPNYRRDVHNGILFTGFCPAEKLTISIRESKASNLRFLYSEDQR